MSLGPFDLTGGPFLTLYGALFLLAVVSGFLIPAWLRPEGRERARSDPEGLAYLAGGETRFAETVVTRLMAADALSITDKSKIWFDRRDAGRTPAERALLALPAPAKWSAAEHVLRAAVRPVRRALVEGELLMGRGTALQLRVWQTSPYLLLLAFGMTKWSIGSARERPVGYLTILLVLTAVLALLRFAVVNPRTRAGNAALTEARHRAERVRRAPTRDEADLAVALFGTAVLVGSPWAGLHQMRSSSDSGSSGSDGSSDGGSGCGGGGCGGCGS